MFILKPPETGNVAIMYWIQRRYRCNTFTRRISFNSIHLWDVISFQSWDANRRRREGRNEGRNERRRERFRNRNLDVIMTGLVIIGQNIDWQANRHILLATQLSTKLNVNSVESNAWQTFVSVFVFAPRCTRKRLLFSVTSLVLMAFNVLNWEIRCSWSWVFP